MVKSGKVGAKGAKGVKCVPPWGSECVGRHGSETEEKGVGWWEPKAPFVPFLPSFQIYVSAFALFPAQFSCVWQQW